MTLLNELQTIANNIEIWPAIWLDSPYITRLAKKPLSKKNEKKLRELNYTKIEETEHFKKTMILEIKD